MGWIGTGGVGGFYKWKGERIFESNIRDIHGHLFHWRVCDQNYKYSYKIFAMYNVHVLYTNIIFVKISRQLQRIYASAAAKQNIHIYK